MSPLVLGLDIGSSCVKAALFEQDGTEQGRAIAAVTYDVSSRKHVERSPEIVWCELKRVISEALHKSTGEVAAIGITGCGNGAVFLNEDGDPIMPGILSSDQRALDQMARLAPPPHCRAYPGQLPFLLKWFRESNLHGSEELAVALFWKDFIRYKLTGLAATDYTDAGAAGLLSDDETNYRIQDPALPPLQPALSIAGTLLKPVAESLGLPAHIPVAVGCIDCEAAAIGCGVHEYDTLSVVAGTWSINQAFTPQLIPEGLFLCNPTVQPERWLCLEGGPDSTSAYNWFRNNLLGKNSHEDLAKAAQPWLARPDKPLFIPRLSHGEGQLVGLSRSHTQASITAAVMEGLVFQHSYHVDQLIEHGLEFRKANLAGGIAREPLWQQLFADVLHLPTQVPLTEEPGTLGAAICAAVAIGWHPTIQEAQHAMVRLGKPTIPGQSYDALYTLFLERLNQ